MAKTPIHDDNILLGKIENTDNIKVIKGSNDKLEEKYDTELGIKFYTPYILQYEDFLAGNNDSPINKLIEENIFNNQGIIESKKDSVIFPLFKFYDINLEFDGVWYRYTKQSFTRKDFLYVFYQFIFGIPTYTCLRKHHDNLEFSIINKFEFDKIKEDDAVNKKRIIEQPVYHEVPDATLQKWSSSYAEMWQNAFRRWQGEMKYHSDNAEHQNTTIIPIKIWTDDNYNIEALRNVLEKFAPNQGYDKKEVDNDSELSLQSHEIFEYFATVSKHKINPDYERIQKRLIEEGINEDISPEELQKQLDIVESFLSNILK